LAGSVHTTTEDTVSCPTRSSPVSVPHTNSPTTSIGPPAWVQQSSQPTSVRKKLPQRTAKQHNPYSSPPTLLQGYLPHREHPTCRRTVTTHALQRTHSGIVSLLQQPSQNNHTSVQSRALPLTKTRLHTYGTHALLKPEEHKSKAQEPIGVCLCRTSLMELCKSLITAPTSHHKPLCVVTDAAQHQGQKGPCPADTRMSQHK